MRRVVGKIRLKRPLSSSICKALSESRILQKGIDCFRDCSIYVLFIGLLGLNNLYTLLIFPPIELLKRARRTLDADCFQTTLRAQRTSPEAYDNPVVQVSDLHAKFRAIYGFLRCRAEALVLEPITYCLSNNLKEIACYRQFCPDTSGTTSAKSGSWTFINYGH